jgi:hypothetical protein
MPMNTCVRKILYYLLSALLIYPLSSCNRDSVDPTVFEIRIENISPVPSFTAQNGARIITFFSSAFAAIHFRPQFLFTQDQADYGQGLQELAENADVSKLLQSFRAASDLEVIGLANEPSSGSIGILAPGQSFTLLLSAVSKDARLSLATCFLQGNDILLMSPDTGIPLFDDNDVPLSGDITPLFSFYDIGTEVNEPPGIGANQVLRQGDPPQGQVSAGARESQPVRLLSDVNDGFTYPSVGGSIRISIRVREFGNS